jgi:hypothetical protein
MIGRQYWDISPLGFSAAAWPSAGRRQKNEKGVTWLFFSCQSSFHWHKASGDVNSLSINNVVSPLRGKGSKTWLCNTLPPHASAG